MARRKKYIDQMEEIDCSDGKNNLARRRRNIAQTEGANWSGRRKQWSGVGVGGCCYDGSLAEMYWVVVGLLRSVGAKMVVFVCENCGGGQRESQRHGRPVVMMWAIGNVIWVVVVPMDGVRVRFVCCYSYGLLLLLFVF